MHDSVFGPILAALLGEYHHFQSKEPESQSAVRRGQPPDTEAEGAQVERSAGDPGRRQPPATPGGRRRRCSLNREPG